MYILNVASATRKMTGNELNDFICETIIKHLIFFETLEKKDLQSFATKLAKHLADPNNTEEYH